MAAAFSQFPIVPFQNLRSATAAQVYDNSDPEPNDAAHALVGLANQPDEFADEEGFLDDDALANIDMDEIEARSPSPVQTRSKRARPRYAVCRSG